MINKENPDQLEDRLRDIEKQVSDLRLELQDREMLLQNEKEQRQFYQLIADFTFGWELWLDPAGKIKYCSPSCYDLTGYTANQVIASPSVSELLVFQADRAKFDEFLSNALNQLLVNPSHEFRMLTRTRQLRWCSVNMRGVYNRQGRYLGIRASVQDITRLKSAFIQINDLTAGKELESRNRQRLKSELEMKERELVAFLLQLSQKNEMISRLTRQIKELSGEGGVMNSKKLDKLLQLADQASGEPFDWNMVDMQLEKLHPGFKERLLQKHPKLTRREKKLCASIRLGLTSKEIAGLNNLAPQSIEIARVRLRKKLRLTHEIRLLNYLGNI
jgi:PAS domain S-box-containing protein